MLTPRVTRDYLVQSDRQDARERAILEATRANSRVRVGRGGAVKATRHAGWWLVTLKVREDLK